ncbi:nuclear pore protein [Niveomyces insectorum RCEF 264]|uniref:Nuclear pore protein n=1 Tax=Niveomyces insectorum RCEF 264 TaxID=1081102 RepID=A0A162IG65_9HYPO|nr:nuclear pore protein [Niveomyces insectorum RCEF 264]
MPAPQDEPPPSLDEQARFQVIMNHGHQDLVHAVAFNAYGDRCATGSVDGNVRVFNRHRDGVWRICDNWSAHSGEILELQWLPPTLYPNLLASLGIEGRFRLWTEDPEAPPGHRFSQGPKGYAKAAFETMSPRSPYRSFSMRHNDATRHTHLALLAADGTLTVLENEVPENLGDYASVDELRVCPKPARGEEASFCVRFDPNPDPCFTALRAGVPADALSLVVAAMDSVKIYRTRPITTASYGLQGTAKAFYLAAEIKGHRGLVRDVAWAPGNFRGYDILATACQDGYVRVVRLDTPFSASDDGKTWSAADVLGSTPERHTASSSLSTNRSKRDSKPQPGAFAGAAAPSGGASGSAGQHQHQHQHHHHTPGNGATTPTGTSSGHSPFLSAPASLASSLSSTARSDTTAGAAVGADAASAANRFDTAYPPASSIPSSAATSFSGIPIAADNNDRPGGGNGAGGAVAGSEGSVSAADRRWTGEAGQVRHVVRELSQLENHRTPVWRVAFDDDGQILGTIGDDGKLLCYRQTPDGSWARSSELTVMKTRMMAP